MTQTNNVCPDCKKTFSKPLERCICGWIRVDPKYISVSDYACRFVEFGKTCNRTGIIALSPRSNEWFCNEHAFRARENSYKSK